MFFSELLAFISYPPIPIWEVGPLRFSLHGLFAALGFVAGAWIATREMRKRGFDSAAYQSCLTWGLIGSLIGARYGTAPSALLAGVPPLEALNPISGNFSILGGFAGGIIAGVWRQSCELLYLLSVAGVDVEAIGGVFDECAPRLGWQAIACQQLAER